MAPSLQFYGRLRGGGPLQALRDEVRHWEALGATGVVVSDHLFVRRGESLAETDRPPEPLTLLAAVGALSERLHVGTIVANAGLLHPALLLRQFAQLAVLLGGERVLAGIGAGWSRDEFVALGMRMPPFAERIERLEEAAALARQLFDQGVANIDGRQLKAHQLPFAPLPAVPPRLLLGGGSPRVMEIAGRYADVVDLNGSARAGKVRGADLRLADKQRRLTTTVSDLMESIDVLTGASLSAGRQADVVGRSVLITDIVFCSDTDVPKEQEALCARAQLPPRSLDGCPYVLIGTPRRMAALLEERRQRLGLQIVMLGGPQAERLCLEVLPLLSG